MWNSDEILNLAIASSGWHNLSEEIVIWDNVKIENWVITWIVKRKNLLTRYKWDSDRFSVHKRTLQKIASNVDFVIIVASQKNPKFQIWFIERYLLLAQICDIEVIICLSKSDLEKISDPILDYYKEKLQIPIFYTSSETWEWFDILKEKIEGKTVVFTWKSWVWKSSIINKILWENIIKTWEVSEKWWQWKHTTTTSKMYRWAENSFIIDTPWIRNLDFLELWKSELQNYFPEFKEFANNCKYNNCLHYNEEKCWIKDAVKNWQILCGRYNFYVKLLNEIR